METKYRYSDGNTYTDNLTLAQARKFKRLQNGGQITPMETKQVEHTPGPWHERTDTIIQFEGDPNHNEECIELGNEQEDTVCYVPYRCNGIDNAEQRANGEANARLIAAAPELLAVLTVLVDHAQEQYPHFESERGQRDIKAALAAIAKATGQDK